MCNFSVGGNPQGFFFETDFTPLQQTTLIRVDQLRQPLFK
jgi:hypothetical protein